MAWLTAINSRLSRWAMYLACLGLIGLVAVVVYGVTMRYGFNRAPPFVEQVALLLVICVAMFGASAGVRDEGHIGVESLVVLLPEKVQHWTGVLVGLLTILLPECCSTVVRSWRYRFMAARYRHWASRRPFGTCRRSSPGS